MAINMVSCLFHERMHGVDKNTLVASLAYSVLNVMLRWGLASLSHFPKFFPLHLGLVLATCSHLVLTLTS